MEEPAGGARTHPHSECLMRSSLYRMATNRSSSDAYFADVTTASMCAVTFGWARVLSSEAREIFSPFLILASLVSSVARWACDCAERAMNVDWSFTTCDMVAAIDSPPCPPGSALLIMLPDG